MKRTLVNCSILCAGVAMILVGCSGERGEVSAPPPSEIRGAPIQKLAQAEPDPVEPAEQPGETQVVVETRSVEAVAPVVDGTPGVDAEETVTGEDASGNNAPAEVEAEVFQSDGREYLAVGFERLASYEFEVTDDLLEAKANTEELTEKTNSLIPTSIRNLNKTSVAVKGYMLPLKVEQGQVTEFLLMRDQSMCCFGTVPRINEWVSVKTIGPGVKPIMDEPVTIFGKLHVGEIRENGYLVGIYRMDGEKLAGALDL